MNNIISAKIGCIITHGEGLTVEFKTAKTELPGNLFETICAFLNHGGGTILLGVADNKTVVGVDPHKADTYCKDITSLSNNPQKLSPSFLLEVNTVRYKGKTLIYIYVPPSSQVHRCNGKVYDRRIDGDYEVKTDTQIRNIYTRKSAYYTEGTIYPYLKVPLGSPREKTVEKTVEKILSLIMLNSNITQQELIDKTGLTRRGVEWNLKKLKAGGRLRRIGPDKGGHWEVSI